MSQRAEMRQILKQQARAPGLVTRQHLYILSDVPLQLDKIQDMVNVTSMYGILATSLNTVGVAYTTSKRGVIGSMKADAAAYAGASCPG